MTSPSLFSFAKFLELLVYSPAICTITPTICEHTNPPPQPWPPSESPLPKSRLNIVRHFGFHGRIVSFRLSIIEDIFELRVPRLQMLRWSAEKEKSSDCSSVCSEPTLSSSVSSDTSRGSQAGEGKRILRQEIKLWWEGVADHLDRLVRASYSPDICINCNFFPVGGYIHG
jgi:1-phosphatidylinositol-3-phosphate 5-kinase